MSQGIKIRIWGQAEAELSPWCLSALRLKYCLDDLTEVEGRVLEVGCGAGMFASAIRRNRPDLKVWGCDLDRVAIDQARKRGQGVIFKIGRAEKLPFRDQSFQAVVSFDVWEHLEQPLVATREAWRVLKPGGIFHFFVPCEGEWYTLAGILKRLGIKPKEELAGHIQQYRSQDLVGLAEQVGFEVRKKYFSAHFLYQLADMGYFLGLGAVGKEMPTTVEGYLAKKGQSGLKMHALGLTKDLISLISYAESTVLKHLPAQGVHLTCRKPVKR